MAEFRLTNKAVVDLNEIWDYTFYNWSEDQADKYYGMLLSLCKDIAVKPEIGRKCEGIRLDLFKLKASRHIIFYRVVRPGMIEITRILHEQMDLKNRLKE